MRIFVTDFAEGRHFQGGSGTQIQMTKAEFTQKVNSLLDSGEAIIKEGAFEFSKILVMENFVQARAGTIRISPHNEEFLVSEYVARREGELPYLARYLAMPPKYKAPVADHLVVIVYDVNQLAKEDSAFERKVLDRDAEETLADYGVVSIQANMIPDAEPMTPMTMYRNALGTKFGGNGVQIDEKALLDAAQFWTHHATIQTV